MALNTSPPRSSIDNNICVVLHHHVWQTCKATEMQWQSKKNNARLVNVVHVVFVAWILLCRHLEQNAFMQWRQEVVKVDMLETETNFLDQVSRNVFTILLFDSIKWILHSMSTMLTLVENEIISRQQVTIKYSNKANLIFISITMMVIMLMSPRICKFMTIS